MAAVAGGGLSAAGVGDWMFDEAQALVGWAGYRAPGLVERIVDRVSRMVHRWTAALADVLSELGPGARATVAAIRAIATGHSPVWAGINGAFSGLSRGVTVLLIVALVLAVLLPPVLPVVLLLAAIVGLLIAAIRTNRR